MNDQHDLSLILRSHFPLVRIETFEESRMLALLERVCNLEEMVLFTWSVADGVRRRGRQDVITQTYNLVDALRHIDKTPQNGVYVLLDAMPFLEDPLNLRLIKEIAQDYKSCARTLVLVGHEIRLPPDLTRFSANFSLSVLDVNGVRTIIREEAQLWLGETGNKAKADEEAVNLMAQHLAGMARDDARRLVRQAIQANGMIDMEDIGRILQVKHKSLGDAGTLELELDTGSFAEVGGQAKLKHWLNLRKSAFIDAVPGLDTPKGILILGVQGSGKSLAAKAVAGSWGVPLLRLDIASLYNKFHGETERNVRAALECAEAMAPCVLWIDEIEKGLATDGGSSDGGVSRRLLGTLLTWMAERKARVFLVSTANDISQLPPELLRKGRIDEIFFVDLPDADVRREILEIHLRRRKLSAAAFEVDRIVTATDGFSGAEIEQALVGALYQAHAERVAIDTEHVLQEVRRTRPLSVVMAEHVAALREWARERTVAAH